jgi:DNA-binding MarR family transcriptional regulator
MKVGILAKSATCVLNKLVSEGPLTPNQLVKKSNLAPRTVASALSQLQRYQLCKKRANLMDMRRPLYYANLDRLTEFEIDPSQLRFDERLFFRLV